MFFITFESLCKEVGKSTSGVGAELGIARSTMSYWRNTPGALPNQTQLFKIANYFNVSTDFLLGKSTVRNPQLVNGDEELTSYLEELRNREDMRMLFSVAKGATKEEVEQAVKIIEALRKKPDNE